MASISTEKHTIGVKLLDEPVPVWRPVEAVKNKDGSYFILPQEIPEFEEWEFLPGDTVMVEERTNERGKYLAAITLAPK